MDILKIIKEKETSRKYKKKAISKAIVNDIIESAVWGPSVHGKQPWRFVFVRDNSVLKKIANYLLIESEKKGAGANILLHQCSDVVAQCGLVVLAYTNGDFIKMVKRLTPSYGAIGKVTELSSASAAIQNMVLTAESRGVSSCWFAVPLLCAKGLNEIAGEKDVELMALVAFGYSSERTRRTKRKDYSQIIKEI